LKTVVRIDNVAERGDTAEVNYSLSDDSTHKTLHLVKQNGKWLASWTKMDAEQEMNTEEEEPAMEETIDTTMSEEPMTDSVQNH
jgi:hypothetical protein